MRRQLLRLTAALLAAALGWVLLVSLAPGSWVATWAPCPRNLAWGPTWAPRVSPLTALRIDLSGGAAKLCYGQPSLKGREMLGGVVPNDRIWRLGANEPTTLHINRLVRLGELVLAPGSYSLYAIPGAREWEIRVNRSIRQWGLESEYTDEIQEREIGRVRVPATRLDAPVEKMTFHVEPAAIGTVDLVFEWQNTTWRLLLDTSPGGESFEGGAPPAPES